MLSPALTNLTIAIRAGVKKQIPLVLTVVPTSIAAARENGAVYTSDLIDTTVAGGFPPYTYQWTTDGTNVIINAPTSEDTTVTVDPSASEDIFLYDPQDYIVRYQFENNADDATYRDHDGTIVGTPLVSPGVIGLAIDLNGDGQYVTFVDDVDFQPTNFTVSNWFKPNSTIAGQTLFNSYFRDLAESFHKGFYLAIDDVGRPYIFVGVNDGNVIGTGFQTALSPDPISTDIPSFIAGVYDGVDLKIYVNGSLKATTSWTIDPVYDSSNVVIIGAGVDADGPTSFANGQIDDSRLYARDSSATQLTAIFNSRNIAPPQDFIAEWRFDGNGDDTLGNHDATPVGSLSYVTGKDGQAVTLNGVDENFTLVDNLALRPTQITLASWVKSTSTASYQGVFTNSQLVESPDVQSGVSLGISNGRPRITIASNTGDVDNTDSVDALAPAGEDILDGEWHHIAGTYDGVDAKIYLDGVLKSSEGYTGGLVYDTGITQRPRIGNRNFVSDSPAEQNFLAGDLDKTQIFGRAATAEEIAAMAAIVPLAIDDETVIENIKCVVTDSVATTGQVIVPFSLVYGIGAGGIITPNAIQVAVRNGTFTTVVVTAVLGGGIGPFTYQWTRVDGFTMTAVFPTSPSTSFVGSASDERTIDVWEVAITDLGNNDLVTTSNIKMTIQFGERGID